MSLQKEKMHFKFNRKHFVSSNENLQNIFWIGDLQVLINRGLCPADSTIAVGKRFLRYIELGLKVN